MRYRAEIDGLRAVAVIPVIFFHAGFEMFSGGFVGVDVFFVISGYLITTIILSELDEGEFSIIKFYERRARRILPALFVVMFFCLPFAWFWLVPQDMKSFSQSLVAVSFFSSNILFWKTSGYFETAAELKPLLHTWSLAVEEQYYFFFPIFLMLSWRLGKRWILAMLTIIALISLAVAEWGSVARPDATFYLLPTRGWELLIGAFVAFCFSDENKWQSSKILCDGGSAIGFLLLMYGIFAFDKQILFPSLYAIVPTIGTALIILFAIQSTVVGRLLGNKLLVGVGLISYSAYLWHQPLFSFARHKSLDEPSKILFGALAISSIVLAYLSWKYVEKPFRSKRGFSRKQVFAYGSIGSAFFIFIGLSGHFTEGFESLKTTEEHRLVLKTATSSPRRSDCHTGDANYRKPYDACEYHNGKLSFAVFGDSHTVELAYSLADALTEYGTKVKHFSFSGCPPAYGRDLEGAEKYCSDWTKEAVEYIASNKNIEYVVVSYRIHSALFGAHEGKYPRLPDEVSDAERELRWASYVGVLKYFVENEKKVILVLQAPELPKPIGALLLRATNPMGDVEGVTNSWWAYRSGYVISRLSQIPSEVVVIDPSKIFCSESGCMAAKDGVAYYFDDDHMSVVGSRLIADEIIKKYSISASHDDSLT
jgi:peptidoglycan/LPS O-acetylase OafA/YrhL